LQFVAQLVNKFYLMEPRIALKPATGPYTDPVESTESRQILTLLVHFNIILPSTRVFQENAL
jgi:hypothetical protein